MGMTIYLSMQQTRAKDGSWNSMVSAHLNGQIFASIGICPYCLMSEEGTHMGIAPSGLKVWEKNGQIPPNTVTHPLFKLSYNCTKMSYNVCILHMGKDFTRF